MVVMVPNRRTGTIEVGSGEFSSTVVPGPVGRLMMRCRPRLVLAFFVTSFRCYCPLDDKPPNYIFSLVSSYCDARGQYGSNIPRCSHLWSSSPRPKCHIRTRSPPLFFKYGFHSGASSSVTQFMCLKACRGGATGVPGVPE